MPRVFRVMKRDANNATIPAIGDRDLGVRPGVDINLGARNNVEVDSSGMSVAPNWRDIDYRYIPRRRKHLFPGAAGNNGKNCFRYGTGAFVQGTFANGLTLEPDRATHGNVAPAQVVPLAIYQRDIEATQADWVEDEN